MEEEMRIVRSDEQLSNTNRSMRLISEPDSKCNRQGYFTAQETTITKKIEFREK
jgi:hypothetical protein